jgi:hypothetical protein
VDHQQQHRPDKSDSVPAVTVRVWVRALMPGSGRQTPAPRFRTTSHAQRGLPPPCPGPASSAPLPRSVATNMALQPGAVKVSVDAARCSGKEGWRGDGAEAARRSRRARSEDGRRWGIGTITAC